MTVTLSEAILTGVSGLLLWSVAELVKLTRLVAALQAHQEDINARLNRLEDKAS